MFFLNHSISLGFAKILVIVKERELHLTIAGRIPVQIRKVVAHFRQSRILLRARLTLELCEEVLELLVGLDDPIVVILSSGGWFVELEGSVWLEFAATSSLSRRLPRILPIVGISVNERASQLIHRGILIGQRFTGLCGAFSFIRGSVAKDCPFSFE